LKYGLDIRTVLIQYSPPVVKVNPFF